MPPSRKVATTRTRRLYTDHDKARVYAQLVINDGNTYRTSKDTGIPNNTIRDWVKLWEAEGPPAAIEMEATAELESYIAEAEDTRMLTLRQIKQLVPQAGVKELGALNAIQGTLTDKIDRAKGMVMNKTEVRHELPDPAKAASFMAQFLAATLDMAKEREQDIIDVEVVEQAPVALPPASI